MERFVRTTTAVSLIIATLLAFGLGCSNESVTSPTDPSASDPLFKKVKETATYIETFDTRRNEGGWSWYTGHIDIWEEEGGNPGGHLHDDNVQSFCPRAGTAHGLESAFTGDYREKNVTSLGIDLRMYNYDDFGDITSRHVTLVLMNDNGTAQNFDDDWGAYFIGPETLPSKYVAMKTSTFTLELVNEPGWKSFDFDVPSQVSELPEGWNYLCWDYQGCNTPPDAWSELMENVSYVQFFYGDPTLLYILQWWDVGMDNPRIICE